MAKPKFNSDDLLPWAIALLIILSVAAYYNRKAFDDYDKTHGKGKVRRGEIGIIYHKETC